MVSQEYHAHAPPTDPVDEREDVAVCEAVMDMLGDIPKLRLVEAVLEDDAVAEEVRDALAVMDDEGVIDAVSDAVLVKLAVLLDVICTTSNARVKEGIRDDVE